MPDKSTKFFPGIPQHPRFISRTGAKRSEEQDACTIVFFIFFYLTRQASLLPAGKKKFRLHFPIDQAHEQNNELVKGPGGAVSLTENPSAFKKWMIAGPEQARLLTEFEREYIGISEDERQHHEEGLSSQKTFRGQTLGVIQVINEMSNPFLDDGSELLALDT